MAENKADRLGTESIPKLLFSMALPAVAAQLINMLYNIVDRIYIGHMEGIGDLALSGVGVSFPIIMIIAAFSAFAGMGGAPIASRHLGAGDKDSAEKVLGNSTTLLLGLAVVLSVLFFILKRPLLLAFGASANTIGYADSYLTIYLCGTLFVQLAMGLNPYISAQGNAMTAMLSVLIGAGINIVLDPIFIFGFHWGVAGAAWATILSQAVSAAWILFFLISKKAKMRLKLKNMRLNWKIVGAIAALGVSPFIMQSTESLVSIAFNKSLLFYGNDMYVGSMTIMLSVMQLYIMPLNGFASGAQPIISYNYGAGNMKRVKKTFRLLLGIILTASLICAGTVMLFPQIFAKLFTDKAELIALTSKMLPVFVAGTTIFGAQMACQCTFLALGQAKISLLMALLRKVILLIPLILILPRLVGVNGIYWAEPVADALAAVITTAVFLCTIRGILGKNQQKT